MPPRASDGGGQQTLSSFFRRAPQAPKRPAPDEVLILDSDDDDDNNNSKPALRPAESSAKRVKTEHDLQDTQLSPIASTSKLRAEPLPPFPPAVPSTKTSRSTSTTEPSISARRIRDFAFASRANGTANRDRSEESQQRHDAFVKKLSLGPDLLKKRNSYLQKEHHLAAAGGDDETDTGVGGVGDLDDADANLGDDDDEPGETESTTAKSRRKGKGKADDDEAGSRLSKFAAPGIAKKGSPAADVKYTPLEKQVIALRKAHPGVLLVVEVRSSPSAALADPD